MAATIRRATGEDADVWLALLHTNLQIDDEATGLAREDIVADFDANGGNETWVTEQDGNLQAAITLLKPAEDNDNPVANLGRCIGTDESYLTGLIGSLLEHVWNICVERSLTAVARLPVSDKRQHEAFERAGFNCTGFQPLKHRLGGADGTLFYVRVNDSARVTRNPFSRSIESVAAIATSVLESFEFELPQSVFDGATGYPLKTDVVVHPSSVDDFDLWRVQSASSIEQAEISSGANHGFGFLRTSSEVEPLAIIGQRDVRVTSGLTYCFDEEDQCVRVLSGFTVDDISMGTLLQEVVNIANDEFDAAYVEIDVVMTAPRFLKCAEQLGFLPVAYLPAFHREDGQLKDVVKLVKLNVPYRSIESSLTAGARRVAGLVEEKFDELKAGVGLIKLLRALPLFDGLGDGELRKITLLFGQKLFQMNEMVFNAGDASDEAYVIMRGQIDIYIDPAEPAIATLGNGQIFGELAFLDGHERTARAISRTPSILLVLKRSEFNKLIEREPHLGMVVLRNIAQDLTGKLRSTNPLTQKKQA